MLPTLLRVSLILSSAVHFFYTYPLSSYICFTLCLSCDGCSSFFLLQQWPLAHGWLNPHLIHLQSQCHCSVLDTQLIDLPSVVEARWKHRPFIFYFSLPVLNQYNIQLLSSSRLLSGPLSSVIRVGVCDVRLHPRLQRVLYRVWCQ